ncbi:hypothetical protein [Brevibacillus sp. SAFN-007a]|uniref:hypothetical protein n=1 Tax=Brevibacillus sp. SAFN-007a TaxID=3436862 RepID=UPI003F8203E2
MEKGLDKFLPTSNELEAMSLDVFRDWVDRAFFVLPERKIQRDPLSHLRKRISEILDGHYATEAEKEEAVWRAINRYYEGFSHVTR